MSRRGENIRKRKDGRWEGRYKREGTSIGSTSYVSIYGKSYREVKEKLLDVKIQKNECAKTKKNKVIFFKDVVLQWKKVNLIKHKGATETKYDYMLEKHILPKLGECKITEIDSLVINDFLQKKLESGRLDGKGGLSKSYVRSMMIIIKSILQYAVNEQLCIPLKTQIYTPSIDKKSLEIINPKKQQLFEQYLLNSLNETKLGILITLHTGLRIGEICALTWDDIDTESEVIHVRNTISRIRNDDNSGSVLIVDKPKTKASIRDIPISAILMPAVYYMRQNAKSQYVVSNKNSFVSPRTYEYRYHRILDECNIESINYHALRHTFATRCIEVGVDVKTLSEILGHSNVAITLNTYVHSSMDLKRAQIEKLSKIYS